MKFELNPYHFNVPESELLDDLRGVAGKLCVESLSQSEYDQHGKFSAATFKKRFVSWNKALSAAGLSIAKRVNIPTEEMLADLHRVAAITKGTTLTCTEYRKHGLVSTSAICRRFGTWEKALKQLGLEPGWTTATTEELFANLESVWRQLGRQPTGDEMVSPLSKFNGASYKRRFGGFRKALEAFVASIDGDGYAQNLEFDELPKEKTDVLSKSSERRQAARGVGWRLRFLTLRRDGFRCLACGKSPANHVGVELVVDHRVAWSKGGETTLENLQTLCLECNGGKSDLDWETPQNEAGASG